MSAISGEAQGWISVLGPYASAWLALIGTLAGSFVTGLVTFFVSRQRQAHERSLEKMRLEAEEVRRERETRETRVLAGFAPMITRAQRLTILWIGAVTFAQNKDLNGMKLAAGGLLAEAPEPLSTAELLLWIPPEAREELHAATDAFVRAAAPASSICGALTERSTEQQWLAATKAATDAASASRAHLKTISQIGARVLRDHTTGSSTPLEPTQ